MPTRIRLQRFGRKHRPFYRVVAADSRAPRDGKFIELLGNYNPLPDKRGVKEIRLNIPRVQYWIGVGAELTDRVKFILWKANVLPPPPIPVRPKRSTPKKVWKEQNSSFSTVAYGERTQLCSFKPLSITPMFPATGKLITPLLGMRTFGSSLMGGRHFSFMTRSVL